MSEIDNNNLLDFESSAPPSAPPPAFEEKTNIDDFLLPNKEQIESPLSDAAKSEDIGRILSELSSSTSESLKDKVFAEADSSTGALTETPLMTNTTSSSKVDDVVQEKKLDETTKKCDGECPYYKLAYGYLNKIKLPPKVEEYILWKNPKHTGALFGTSLIFLFCLASFSFMSVFSTLGMLALTGFGAYRLYLAIIFRIKGTQDDSFEKWSAINLSVPTKEMAHYCETNVNNLLNKAKSIVLWDNITVSAVAFLGFYFIYCIGSIFNTLTLVILLHVSAFTLPKVYQVYKVQIDSALKKASDAIHKIVQQVMVKLPFLNQKKTQ